MSIGLIIFLILAVMKLAHIIAWSWWWVAAPLMFEVIVTIIVFALAGMFFGASQGVFKRKR